MKHPKKLQAMLDRLKWNDLAYTATVLCEYQVKSRLDEYEVEEEQNFKRLYFRGCGSNGFGAAMYELIKDKKITYLCFRELRIGHDYEDEDFSEYKHPNYGEIFRCEDIERFAEEITPESHAKLLFELANGDYDDEGNYTGYSGNYEGFCGTEGGL